MSSTSGDESVAAREGDAEAGEAHGGDRAADTGEAAYTERLLALETRWWKRVVPVQAPYRWNLRRLRPGYTLDIGCGLGRNLEHLGGSGVGIDHNPTSVAVVRARGFVAYTPEAFEASTDATEGAFDSILLAHVAEHMTSDEVVDLVGSYVRYLREDGKVIFMCPQERGFRSDATHVEFMDIDALADIASRLGLTVIAAASFPFPRAAGRWFAYNEFVVVARR